MVSQVNTTTLSAQNSSKQAPLTNIQNQMFEGQKVQGINQDSKLGSSFSLSPVKEVDINREDMRLQNAFAGINILRIEKLNENEEGNNQVDDNDDIEPLIFDIEEIECKMSDIEELSDDASKAKSIRGSLIHTPKDFPCINPSGKISDSQTSMQSQILELDYEQYKNFQDFLKYDTDRNLDISMSSVCSTPRQFNMEMNDESPSEILSPSQFQKQRIHNKNQQRRVDDEGSINPKFSDTGMTPRLHQQNSLSSQRLNDSYLLNQSHLAHVRQNNKAYSTSERSNVQFRSSAEMSEIEREVNKHKKYQNSLSSYEKNMDPETIKRNLQISMQLQLQTLVTKIHEKEKLFLEQEKLYNQLQQQLQKVEDKASIVEQKLKKENNINVNLRTQLNFLLQSQFDVSQRQWKYQRNKAKNSKKFVEEVN